MSSFVYDIGEKKRVGSRFVAHVRDKILYALITEKADRKLTQQSIAEKLGVNRSVINRQLNGLENLSLRRVAELLWAMGWEAHFEVRKIKSLPGENDSAEWPAPTASSGENLIVVVSNRQPNITIQTAQP